MNAKKFLKESKLNWTVSAQELSTKSGLISKQVSIVRDDINKELSVKGSGYEIYQNEQLIELLMKVTQQTGLELHKGGFFGDGEKVFIQLKSDNLTLGTDRIEGFVTGVNSFDGTTSLAFGNSNITISCQNTFFAAFKGLNSKVRHTKNMHYKIEDILKQMDLSIKQEKLIFDNIVRLSQAPVTQKSKDIVIRTMLDIKPNIMTHEDISTYNKNKMVILDAAIRHEMEEKGATLWGAFSGATYYSTHKVIEGDNTEAKLFGIYGTRERETFNKLVELVH